MDKLSYFILAAFIDLTRMQVRHDRRSKRRSLQKSQTEGIRPLLSKTPRQESFPEGWSSETSTWSVVNEDENAALQMNKNGGKDFNIAVLKYHSYNNIELEARGSRLLAARKTKVAGSFGVTWIPRITTSSGPILWNIIYDFTKL